VTRIARFLGVAAIAVVGAAYLVFSHFLTIDEHPNLLMLVVGVTPLTAMAVLVAWHSRMRWPAMLALAALALLVTLYLDELRNHVNWLYFMQHVGTMSLLAITFGATLGRGDADALCSRVTRMLLPSPADPVYMRYTWKVTLIWTIYFIASAVLSVGLFFLGPLVVWSFFANLLTPVTVGLMFVVEYLVRVRVLPNREHYSIAQIVQAYRAYERR
jgi:uncharacterized membrane protein